MQIVMMVVDVINVAHTAGFATFAGTIPAELEGTLLRNGPGLLEIGGTALPQPLDGDGMVKLSAAVHAVVLLEAVKQARTSCW